MADETIKRAAAALGRSERCASCWDACRELVGT
jgi:hypothetical protein